ncbi:transcriptional regulator [Roseobacter cerasinus]|uniref:Transcriptional regulator n=1 Tax=Roseobacter cerasinus TaxID=2602289 RepID=A0A640VU46_9RHOB|nr:AraC family transcriptional regulator [Roseobacter cerasinus]GFE51559.1 transcriptional regulator [Roseobacter cerasinus]
MGRVTSLFAHKMVASAGDAVDGHALLRVAGLDPDAPRDPKVMISDAAYYAMLEDMASQTDVTALPITVGAAMRCDEYGALGLAWKAAPNLLGSFARVERYARLWTSVVEYELRRVERGVLFILHRAGPRRLGMRLSNEATLASAVSIARQVSPVPVVPLEVTVKHPAPRSLAAHEAYFGCPLQFESAYDALLLSDETLLQPNILGDEGITQFIVSHLDAEIADFETEVDLVRQTKDGIARALSEGLPKMADVAKGMGFSVRSFHRRLAEHGVSFQVLTEETRRELALGMLRDERYSLSEIAFLTGFSEQSAFTRAFKRWMGQTPASYRRGGAGS